MVGSTLTDSDRTEPESCKKNLPWPWLGSLLYLFFMLILPIFSLVATAGERACHILAHSDGANCALSLWGDLVHGFSSVAVEWLLWFHLSLGSGSVPISWEKVLDMAVDLPLHCRPPWPD
jgi:hypothetical protein